MKGRRGFILGLLALPFLGKAAQAPPGIPVPTRVPSIDPTIDEYATIWRERTYFSGGPSIYFSEATVPYEHGEIGSYVDAWIDFKQ